MEILIMSAYLTKVLIMSVPDEGFDNERT
jgi:hypothetical protein